MTLSFQAASDFNRITKAIEKLNTNRSSNPDEEKTFWQPELGKDGNGYAVIRFMPGPAVDGNDAAWFVFLRSFGFQGPNGSWYIENSRLTIGEQDPVEESNARYWKMGPEGEKVARARLARKQYISNIYIVKDKANPENEGKVFRFRYGKKIMDKLMTAMKPEFEDEKPINPFDLINGANFQLKIKKVEGYRNYDASGFAPAGRLENFSDEKLEEIYNQCYSLKELVDPETRFKSYDELKRNFERVVGVEDNAAGITPAPIATTNTNRSSAGRPTAKADVELNDEIPDFHSQSGVDPVDDNDLDYFRKLAEED